MTNDNEVFNDVETVEDLYNAFGLNLDEDRRYLNDRDARLNFFQQMTRLRTGRSIFDSGGAYGYISDQPANDREVNVDEYNASVSLAHFLAAGFSPLQLLTARLDEDEYMWTSDMIGKIKKHFPDTHVDTEANTYNYDNDLNQGIQYFFWELEDAQLIVIQTHNGCDVRGGYTSALICEVVPDKEFDWFYSGMCLQIWGSNVNDPDEYVNFDYVYEVFDESSYRIIEVRSDEDSLIIEDVQTNERYEVYFSFNEDW